jgi:hypothetical protein
MHDYLINYARRSLIGDQELLVTDTTTDGMRAWLGARWGDKHCS